MTGNRFQLCGEAVWQLLRGDWFDASVTYRDWVRREAKWFPKLGPDGRDDTPPWMRGLSVWALGGGTPGEQHQRDAAAGVCAAAASGVSERSPERLRRPPANLASAAAVSGVIASRLARLRSP
jgi:hypothetical protein